MTNQQTAGHAIAAMEKLYYDPRSGNNGMRRVTCECGWSRRGSQYTCRRLHGLHAAAEANVVIDAPPPHMVQAGR